VYPGGASEPPEVAEGAVGMTQVPVVAGGIPPVPAVPMGVSSQGSTSIVVGQPDVQFVGTTTVAVDTLAEGA